MSENPEMSPSVIHEKSQHERHEQGRRHEILMGGGGDSKAPIPITYQTQTFGLSSDLATLLLKRWKKHNFIRIKKKVTENLWDISR